MHQAWAACGPHHLMVHAQLLKLSTVLYKLIYWKTRGAPGCQESMLKYYTSSGRAF